MDRAIPAWLPKHLGQSHLVLEHVVRHDLNEREIVPFDGHKALITCGGPQGCNGYFGVHLEERAKHLLIPALAGQSATYDAEQQEVLAAWAFKVTGSLLGIERKRRAIPSGNALRSGSAESFPPHASSGWGGTRAAEFESLLAGCD